MNSSTSSSETSHLRKLAAGILFALALCPFAERGLLHLVWNYGTNESLLLYRFQLERSHSPKTHAEVVFVGDSSLRSSVNPADFLEASGHTALNFGLVSSSGFMSDFYLLQAYLESHPPPRLLVMVHGFDVYNVGFNEALYTVHFATPDETLALYRLGEVTAKQGANSLLTGLLPSYRHKPYLRNLIQPLLLGDLDILKRARAQNTEFLAAMNARGYLPDPATYRGSPPAARGPFVISSINAWYMSRILELVHKHGVRVAFLAGPLDSAHVGPLKASEWYRGYVEYLDRLGRTEGVFDAHCGVRGFTGDELGASANHLSPKGARRFSRQLAECLEALLPPERAHAVTPRTRPDGPAAPVTPSP